MFQFWKRAETLKRSRNAGPLKRCGLTFDSGEPCTFGSYSDYNIDRHLRTNHFPKPQPCKEKDCPAILADSVAVAFHNRVRHINYFLCMACSRRSQNRTTFENHVATCQDPAGSVQCLEGDCDVVSPNMDIYWIHLLRVHGLTENEVLRRLVTANQRRIPVPEPAQPRMLPVPAPAPAPATAIQQPILVMGNYLEGKQVVKHPNLWILYDLARKQPCLVHQTLTRENLVTNVRGVTRSYAQEPDISHDLQYCYKDYLSQPNYQKGHLAAVQFNKMNLDSFQDCNRYSNLVPQTDSFNKGIWAQTENKTKEMVAANFRTEVTAGTLFPTEPRPDTFMVPDTFWKIVTCFNEDGSRVDGDGTKVWIIPHEASDGNLTTCEKDLEELETRTKFLLLAHRRPVTV